jgi:hypothetical protein
MNQREKAEECLICHKKDFDMLDVLYKYLCGLREEGEIRTEDFNPIARFVHNRYSLADHDCSLATHHINYFDNKTIRVCTKCHAKIHHSKNKKYDKYRQTDRKNRPLLVEGTFIVRYKQEVPESWL